MQGSKASLIARPVKVIRLSGSNLDIGRQHGEQLRDEIVDGMPFFFVRFWDHLGQGQPQGLIGKFLSRFGLKTFQALVEKFLMASLWNQYPEFAKDTLRGMANGAMVSERTLKLAAVLPDVGPLLMGYLGRLRPSIYLDFSPPRFGCSSFVSSGEKFLIGRNLDFPGVGFWDRYPVFQVTQRPGWLKTLHFTTSGVSLGGISGINEAQIYVGLHQHYSLESNRRGLSPLCVGEEVLGRCSSLEQAVQLLAERNLATNWAFVIADGKTKEACIVEKNPTVQAVRFASPQCPVLTHSNFFQCKETATLEFSASTRMSWDNYFRNDRIKQKLQETGQSLGPLDALKIISDHWDPYLEQEKISNRMVSQLYNIQSFVLDPAEMRLWFAEGPSPIHLNEFQEWDLSQAFDRGPTRTPHTFPGFQFVDPSKKTAKVQMLESMQLAWDGNWKGAYSSASHSFKLAPSAETGLTLGQVALKLGEFRTAQDWLEKAMEISSSRAKELGKSKPPEYFEALLFKARACDLLGNYREAKALRMELSQCEELQDAHLRFLAKRERKYQASLLSAVQPYSTYCPFF